MSRRIETLRPDYFEGLYAGDSDPWKFATSDYEREKYARTLGSLPQKRYTRALEIGCSIGVLTYELALRCGYLLAVDAASEALKQARQRCAAISHVEFAEMFVPGDWPDGQFDLILLSEVVYYLEAADVARLAERVASALAPGGNVILVHWTGETDYPLTGDEAAERFIANAQTFADVMEGDRQPQYRLDALVRR